MLYKSEAQLQAKCYGDWSRKYPEEHRNRKLRLIYNNAPNGVVAAMLKSMGMQPGTADMLYYTPRGTKHWLEFKLPGETQSKAQEEFEAMVRAYGEDYDVVDSEEVFWIIMNKLH